MPSRCRPAGCDWVHSFAPDAGRFKMVWLVCCLKSHISLCLFRQSQGRPLLEAKCVLELLVSHDHLVLLLARRTGRKQVMRNPETKQMSACDIMRHHETYIHIMVLRPSHLSIFSNQSKPNMPVLGGGHHDLSSGNRSDFSHGPGQWASPSSSVRRLFIRLFNLH